MFRFRLQRVLELRQKSEQEAATRLAEAQSGEVAARQTCALLEGVQEEGIRQAAAPGASRRVGQLQNLRFFVERMGEQVMVARGELAAAEQEVSAKMEEFSVAFRDRRILDRLRDKALESYRVEEVQADRKLMDDIALSRFARSRVGGDE